MKMTPNKPYLIRAVYDWIVDNQLTPLILVNAEYPGVEVPQEHVNSGKIVLDISPSACRGLHLDNDKIVFTARFSGISTQIYLSPAAVMAIYSQENGRGMEFGPEYDEPFEPSGKEESKPVQSGKKPSLTLVKKD